MLLKEHMLGYQSGSVLPDLVSFPAKKAPAVEMLASVCQL